MIEIDIPSCVPSFINLNMHLILKFLKINVYMDIFWCLYIKKILLGSVDF